MIFRKRRRVKRREDTLCMCPALGAPWRTCLRHAVVDGMCLDHAGHAGYFKPATRDEPPR